MSRKKRTENPTGPAAGMTYQGVRVRSAAAARQYVEGTNKSLQKLRARQAELRAAETTRK